MRFPARQGAHYGRFAGPAMAGTGWFDWIRPQTSAGRSTVKRWSNIGEEAVSHLPVGSTAVDEAFDTAADWAEGASTARYDLQNQGLDWSPEAFWARLMRKLEKVGLVTAIVGGGIVVVGIATLAGTGVARRRRRRRAGRR